MPRMLMLGENSDDTLKRACLVGWHVCSSCCSVYQALLLTMASRQSTLSSTKQTAVYVLHVVLSHQLFKSNVPCDAVSQPLKASLCGICCQVIVGMLSSELLTSSNPLVPCQTVIQSLTGVIVWDVPCYRQRKCSGMLHQAMTVG